jgi:hypothetical protein
MAQIKKTSYKLDVLMITKLASIMCSYEEIASVMGTSVDNLKKRYKDIIENGRAEGKKSLRRKQMEVALEKGDVRMLIFLGKNYLDQKDTPTDAESQEPLPWPNE